MYQLTLVCKGVPSELGQQGVLDITEEFMHRPWHQSVSCTWDGEQLILCAENDWDPDGKAILDEFSDAVSACISGTFESELQIRSIRSVC